MSSIISGQSVKEELAGVTDSTLPPQASANALSSDSPAKRAQAAAIAGLVLGVVSHIPVISLFPVVCSIAGGVFAVYLWARSSSQSITVIEGMLAGCVAGAVAAALYGIIAGIIAIAGSASSTQMPDPFGLANLQASGGAAIAYAQVIAMGVVLPVFGTLGGALGLPLLRRRNT
jgi:hypothetical protein